MTQPKLAKRLPNYRRPLDYSKLRCSSGSPDFETIDDPYGSREETLKRVIRQWAGQFLGLFPRRPHPGVGLFLRQQQDRHGLFMDRLHQVVGIRGQKPIEIVGGQAVPDLSDALPLRHMETGKEH